MCLILAGEQRLRQVFGVFRETAHLEERQNEGHWRWLATPAHFLMIFGFRTSLAGKGRGPSARRAARSLMMCTA
ncbi:MAG: hypothetical protein A3D16_21595 [Rhodobacterales bacterium RIFCSPHIGHO2_02_FULL_62_130]|nr:MAG: hypothetical protein A3D16_21595 [Rhodobacterales bacterium RIFCSPHIGHO2_02_FULL_62_130]OHC54891.1 MAG: hypothetical protein A3E48_00510 [Rhodobacterales bacterium RIFCSPHIGHO2_12_FULL_62_75]HCY98910.1 hypothetical protein [Rhodobacter sp.]